MITGTPDPHDTLRAPEGSARPSPDPLATLQLKPRVIEALSLVFDPEIPVNIYELGLVYDIIIGADRHVHVAMTLTSPACPAAQHLPVEVQTRLRALPDVTDATVEIVWEPQWTPDRMSEVARLELGML